MIVRLGNGVEEEAQEAAMVGIERQEESERVRASLSVTGHYTATNMTTTYCVD